MNFLLDTNVISEWVKPQPDPNVVAWLAEVDEDHVFMSVASSDDHCSPCGCRSAADSPQASPHGHPAANQRTLR